MFYIGIDPGQGGGISAIHDSGNVHLSVKMPPNDAGVWEILNSFGSSSFAVIEHVWSSPQMGVASAFKFGRGYGALCMALVGCRITFKEVTPQVWQRYMDCRTGGEKNISKDAAQKLFPSIKVTHALADSLLIAEYTRRVHTF